MLMLRSILAFSFTLSLAACGDDNNTNLIPDVGDPDPDGPSNLGTPQTPPTGATALDAWIAEGHYKLWNCEAKVHGARSPGPHGFNRICTNDALSNALPGTSDWPVGAAAVKELYASAAGGTPTGYAVYLKQGPTAAGAGWYWYEKVDGNVAADGLGDAGVPKSVCVGCHVGAGSDPAHTPTAGGRDMVYSPIAPQTPPSGAVAVDAWLAQGYYKSWHCEADVHAGRAPTPHGFNRICSNNAIAENVAGTAPWPAGAAAVKELHASVAGGAPIGYAVYVKQDANSNGGANWYWYEKLPAPDGVIADGKGDSGAAMTICVGCHTGAGSDPEHTPSPGARDQVYSPIP